MTRSDRYARQRVLPEIGDEGQERLLGARVVLIGCGALGCAQAQLLVRAGVGHLRIADRDIVELENLHRQVLFDEEDAERGRPKAEAAARRLRDASSEVTIEPLVKDVTARNILDVIDSADIVLDATDNVETRYLINDACLSSGLPWIYGGVVGTEGLVMPIVPERGPCLRCVFPEPPPPGTLPTCDVAGVLNTGPVIVASLQVTAAFRVLLGSPPDGHLLTVDPWRLSFRRIELSRQPDCPCCGEGRLDFLRAAESSSPKVLCGQYAVQVSAGRAEGVDLSKLAARLSKAATVEVDEHLLRISVGEQEILVFADGRAIVRGTNDVARARVLYSRFIGA